MCLGGRDTGRNQIYVSGKNRGITMGLGGRYVANGAYRLVVFYACRANRLGTGNTGDPINGLRAWATAWGNGDYGVSTTIRGLCINL